MASRRKREAPPARATAPRIDAGPTGTPHADGARKDRRRRTRLTTVNDVPMSRHSQRARSKRVNGGNKWSPAGGKR